MSEQNHHINQEITKLIQQDELLQRLIDQAQDEHNQGEKIMMSARHTLTRVQQERSNIRYRLLELRYLINSEKPTATNSIQADIDLPSDYMEYSLWNKIQFFMGAGWQTASELLAKVLEHEPAIARNEELKKKLSVNLYSTLHNKFRTFEILREKVSGEFLYSMPGEERQPIA